MNRGKVHALALVALAHAGCIETVEFFDNSADARERDKQIVVTADPFVLVGGVGYFSVADACTPQDNPECEADQLTVTGMTAEGDLALWFGNSFIGGDNEGSGKVTVTTVNQDLVGATGSTRVGVRLPDGANLSPNCANGAPPYWVPPASEVGVTWRFTLEGVEHDGTTGEVPVEAPELVFVRSIYNGAFYLTPETPGTVASVSSTLGESSFDFTVYDPTVAVLAVIESPSDSDDFDGATDFDVVTQIDGHTACEDPGTKTVTTETPSICVFLELQVGEGGKLESVEVESLELGHNQLRLLPVAEGTCRVQVSIEGTPLVKTFDLPVVPVSWADLPWQYRCKLGGETCGAMCPHLPCSGDCCYENRAVDCASGSIECTYRLVTTGPPCTEPTTTLAPYESRCWL